MSQNFELIDEYRTGVALREEIRMLLHKCFPESGFTERRRYLKQLPQKRLLARDGNLLVGHIGIEHRMVWLGDSPAEIVGLIDVAVDPEHQGRRIASRMTSSLLHEYGQHSVDFAVLFARDRRLYEKQGFVARQNRLSWLKIHEHRNFGIAEECVPELMVKELSRRKWTDEPVDLLGYLF